MVLSQLGTPLSLVGCHSPGIGASHTSFLTPPTPPPPPSTLVETLLDLSLSSGPPLPNSR